MKKNILLILCIIFIGRLYALELKGLGKLIPYRDDKVGAVEGNFNAIYKNGEYEFIFNKPCEYLYLDTKYKVKFIKSIKGKWESNLLKLGIIQFNDNINYYGSLSNYIPDGKGVLYTGHRGDRAGVWENGILKKLFCPLHVALYEEDIEKFKSLLKNSKEEINKLDSDHRHIIEILLFEEYYDEDLIKLVVSHPFFNTGHLSKNKRSLLHLACLLIRKDSNLIELLLEKGCDPNLKDDKGETPLMYLVKKTYANTLYFEKFKKILTLAISKGADLDIRDPGDRNIIHHSVIRDHLNITKYLIELGLDVNSKDQWGRTPLMYSNRFEHLKGLFEKGADLHVIDNNGENIYYHLNEMFSKDLLHCIDFLLEKNVDYKHKNNKGETPLESARKYGNTVLSNYLNNIYHYDELKKLEKEALTCVFLKNEYEEGISKLNKLIEQLPDKDGYFLYKGIAFLRNNNYSRAMEIFTKYDEMKLKFNDKHYYYNLAIYHYKTKSYKKSLSYINWIKKNPGPFLLSIGRPYLKEIENEYESKLAEIEKEILENHLNNKYE